MHHNATNEPRNFLRNAWHQTLTEHHDINSKTRVARGNLDPAPIEPRHHWATTKYELSKARLSETDAAKQH